MLIGIIIASVAAFILILLLLFAIISDRMVFGIRYDKKPYLKYFTAEDFSLYAEPVSVTDKLRGFIYNGREDNGKILIFCHGLGPGHAAYTTEIAYFCNEGYTVLAVDSLGCDISGGKSMRGFYEGVRTAERVIEFTAKNDRLKDKPIYLLGHSWGGYTVLCVTKTPQIKGVVAISAPSSPAKAISNGAESVISKPLAIVLRPFWYIVNFFKFGKNGNMNAAKRADESGVPVLLIHGDMDKMVKENNAALYKVKGSEEKLICRGQDHNPYLTFNAKKLLGSLSRANPAKDKEFFENFDFKGATEEDKEVMQKISDFFESC